MKSLTKLSFWAGIAWALLLAGAAGIYAPEQFGQAGWVVVLMAGAGWHAIYATVARSETLAELQAGKFFRNACPDHAPDRADLVGHYR